MKRMRKSTLLYMSIGGAVVLGIGGWMYAAAPRHEDAAAQSAAAGGAVANNAPAVAYEGSAPAPAPGAEIAVNPSGTSIAPLLGKSAPPPEGYIEYRNQKYSFSFYHGPEATLKEYDEGAGATTIVLENYQKKRGFQIFIVPYTESKISEARFRQDVPSGVRTNVENTTLDGVQAVTFNSTDQLLGDTREIWTIRGGYLYEITTFSGVGNWFAPIIRSWKFL